VPVSEVIKRQPKEIILSALARTGEQAPAYITLAFIFTYGQQVLHQSLYRRRSRPCASVLGTSRHIVRCSDTSP
jgi:hypothetical protein